MIYTQKITIPTSKVYANGENSLPDFKVTLLGQKFKNLLDEDDGLFINYSPNTVPFPYAKQNAYSRELVDTVYDAVILENEHLKVTVLPQLGGRVYSIYDKNENRDLVYKNPVIRFGNLAIRNSWFSGGIEWNCGITGHSPYTCSPIYAKIVTDGENEILRMYEFERIRQVTYMVDLFIPENSKFLHCHMKVKNTTEDTIPMYWWSNTAVKTGGNNLRTIVHANYAYTNADLAVMKIPVPYGYFEGVDTSYSDRSPRAIDYFFKVEGAHRYIAAVDDNGKGLLHLSSSRLQGKKLFTWGKGKGATRWQEYLSGNGDNGQYCEIQAGLARTQYESIPMPPKTAWEWLELYGAITLDKDKAHGAYAIAQAETEGFISDNFEEGYADNYLEKLRYKPINDIKTVCEGSSWATLENIRRKAYGEEEVSKELKFNPITKEQEAWQNLLEKGTMGKQDPTAIPPSYMRQQEWIDLMEKAIKGKDKNNWYTYYQLGCTYIALNNLAKAKNRLYKADALAQSTFIKCAIAQYEYLKGNYAEATEYALKGAQLGKGDEYVQIHVATLLYNMKEYQKLADFTSQVDQKFEKVPRILLYRAFSLVELGKTEEAESILEANGGLEIPDIQESETSIGELWFKIQQQKAQKTGEEFEKDYTKLPYKYSFQMGGEN